MKIIIQNLERFPARSSFFRGCFVGIYDGFPTTISLMATTEASTYGSGSINATFASDILRLQDLWTGIMWSLLSPLSRVLITIIYAFTVSPQALDLHLQSKHFVHQTNDT